MSGSGITPYGGPRRRSDIHYGPRLEVSRPHAHMVKVPSARMQGATKMLHASFEAIGAELGASQRQPVSLHRWLLCFTDDAVEAEFQLRSLGGKRLTRIRRSIVFTAVLAFLLLLPERLILAQSGDTSREEHGLLIGLSVSSLLVGTAVVVASISLSNSRNLFRMIRRRAWPSAIVITYLACVQVFSYAGHLLPPDSSCSNPYSLLSQADGVVVTVQVLTVQAFVLRLPFWLMAIGCGFVFVTTPLSLHYLPLPLLLNRMALLLVACSVICLTSRQVERMTRIAWWNLRSTATSLRNTASRLSELERKLARELDAGVDGEASTGMEEVLQQLASLQESLGGRSDSASHELAAIASRLRGIASQGVWSIDLRAQIASGRLRVKDKETQRWLLETTRKSAPRRKLAAYSSSGLSVGSGGSGGSGSGSKRRITALLGASGDATSSIPNMRRARTLPVRPRTSAGVPRPAHARWSATESSVVHGPLLSSLRAVASPSSPMLSPRVLSMGSEKSIVLAADSTDDGPPPPPVSPLPPAAAPVILGASRAPYLRVPTLSSDTIEEGVAVGGADDAVAASGSDAPLTAGSSVLSVGSDAAAIAAAPASASAASALAAAAASEGGDTRRSSDVLLPGEVAGEVAGEPVPRRPSLSSIPDELVALDLEALSSCAKVGEWEFDVFEFAEHSRGQPLYALSVMLFRFHSLLDALPVSDETVRTYFWRISNLYREDVPYHNQLHGAEVLHGVHYFLARAGLGRVMSADDTAALLLAAAVHDVAHPGRNNNFLIVTHNDLALLYNDISPLENMHVSTAFLTMRRSDCHLLDAMDNKAAMRLRKHVIAAVLDTDLAKHFESLGQFRVSLASSEFKPSSEDAHKLVLLRMALKAADLSHASKPWEQHRKWTAMVTSEFYEQGDEERDLGMTVSAMSDRTKANLPKAQVAFVGACRDAALVLRLRYACKPSASAVPWTAAAIVLSLRFAHRR
eukprot:PLAT12521.5.p1 GENE.PLAT12521.5~~PLAT12521.5.p1  ORF type:complete len:987 (+),score=448.17 PLAT12521.5:38-2962(+)